MSCSVSLQIKIKFHFRLLFIQTNILVLKIYIFTLIFYMHIRKFTFNNMCHYNFLYNFFVDEIKVHMAHAGNSKQKKFIVKIQMFAKNCMQLIQSKYLETFFSCKTFIR